LTLALPYMGTKRGVAPAVRRIIARARPGVVLDAFSGMCAIGQSIGTSRNVWNNDVQRFAANVASALFTSRRGLTLKAATLDALLGAFNTNYQLLRERFTHRLKREKIALKNANLAELENYLASSRHVGNSPSLEAERARLSLAPTQPPYRLFTITFADGYFGFQQAMEIDSAKYALDSALNCGAITDDEFRWLLIAMCRAAVRVAATTGHFAQYLKLKSNNLAVYVRQRQRDFWDAWIEAADGMRPMGSRAWRRGNRTFNCESLTLIGFLCDERQKPSVIYADPPYTDDQYSRYYHVWETLIRYDYPTADGVGRYRPDRFHTSFSRLSEVGWAFSELVRRSAALDADLVLSYPNKGLLHHADLHPIDLLRRHYKRVELAATLSHAHSTMGGSKGDAVRPVKECIYFARNT
jgi:adenine-specific DNA-methyltransferase